MSAEHDKTPFLLWVDLETTGTDPERDYIIEFAGILTHSDTLEEVFRVERVVDPWLTDPDKLGVRDLTSAAVDSRSLSERICRTPQAVLEMHDASGLWVEVDDSLATIADVEDVVLQYLTTARALHHRTAIAGSGVSHFDMRFIHAQMPKLAKEVRYWQLDIGPLRRADALWGGPSIQTRNDDKPHRAMDDALIHLEDARRWRSFLRGEG